MPVQVATHIADHSCSFPFSYFSPKFLPFSLIDLSRVIPDHFGKLLLAQTYTITVMGWEGLVEMPTEERRLADDSGEIGEISFLILNMSVRCNMLDVLSE